MSPDVSGGRRRPLMQLPYAMVDPRRRRNELLLRQQGGSHPRASAEAAAAALGRGCFRLAFRPRFYDCSNHQRNQLENKKKWGGCASPLFVQNLDALLVVIIISAGKAIFAKFNHKLPKHVNLYNSRYMLCCFFLEAAAGRLFWVMEKGQI